MSETGSDRLTYLRNGEIREEIAYAVGADPTRYGIGSDRGLQKSDLVRIAEQLQPSESDVDVRECQLGKLYELVCDWVGGEYHANAGNPWGLKRENLKKVHRAVEASDPREVVA